MPGKRGHDEAGCAGQQTSSQREPIFILPAQGPDLGSCLKAGPWAQLNSPIALSRPSLTSVSSAWEISLLIFRSSTSSLFVNFPRMNFTTASSPFGFFILPKSDVGEIPTRTRTNAFVLMERAIDSIPRCPPDPRSNENFHLPSGR